MTSCVSSPSPPFFSFLPLSTLFCGGRAVEEGPYAPPPQSPPPPPLLEGLYFPPSLFSFSPCGPRSSPKRVGFLLPSYWRKKTKKKDPGLFELKCILFLSLFALARRCDNLPPSARAGGSQGGALAIYRPSDFFFFLADVEPRKGKGTLSDFAPPFSPTPPPPPPPFSQVAGEISPFFWPQRPPPPRPPLRR